jgi:hypothetical protein
MTPPLPRLAGVTTAAVLLLGAISGAVSDPLPAGAGNASSYQTAVLADNPVLFYPLDDAASPAVNRSPALGPCQTLFNGTASGGVTFGAPGFVQPHATAYDGHDGVITIPSPSACGAGFSPITTFTVETWFNAPPAFVGNGYLVTLLGTTSGVGIDAGHLFGHVNLQSPSSAPTVSSPATYNDGHWHHAALTDDGLTLRLYVDGGQVAQIAGLSGTLVFDAGTQGAIGSNGSAYFSGVLQDVAGYPAALTLARIQAHYAAGTAPVDRFPVDFDGDGRTDISVFRPAGGSWFSRPSAGGAGQSTSYGANGDVPVPADYDHDGKADIAIFRPTTGLWAIHPSGGSPDIFVTYGVGSDVPVPADYDGDGKADIALFRPSTGAWFVHRSSDGADAITTFGGIPGDLAVPADYDGDGRTDLAIFRDGTWFVHPSSGGGDSAVSYGVSGDIPVAGDYDGDGRTDVAVFRPSTGLWAVHESGGGDLFVTYGGIPGDVPVPGDYDGDLRTDIGVFRPSVGTWYTRRSTDGDTAVAFGVPSDTPLALPPAVRSRFF